MPRHDAVAEVRRMDRGVPVGHERVKLDERIRVKQQLDSLARRQLSAPMLLVDPLLATTETRLFPHRSKARETSFVRRQGVDPQRIGLSFAQGQPSSYGPSYPRKW